jgi:glycogen synthase
MKVLMFGWEFPPFNTGGLGTACYGLTKGLVEQGHNVTFVLPKAKSIDSKSHVKLLVANDIETSIEGGTFSVKEVDSLLAGYLDSTTYSRKYLQYIRLMNQKVQNASDEPLYGKNLYEEVNRFADKAKVIAAFEDFEVIHCHDWMTYDAGINAKKVSGKPLVIHVHATEFDRTGKNVNQYVYDIERKGMHLADSIIAVSEYTKQMIVNHYAIDPSKVSVVYNAVDFNGQSAKEECKIKNNDKVVLFLGRITMQKGPEYFMHMAKKVLEKEKNVKFVVVGSGDQEGMMIDMSHQLGIGNKMLFSGFLRGKDIDKAFSMADVYVMPSVSEPFGITPLEAMKNGTPCVISKQSGVSEVLSNCLKVDFWDVHKMADLVLGIIKYDSVHKTMKQSGLEEIKSFTWHKPARECAEVYSKLLSR